MRALRLKPQSAMAIYAHPDDADVAAGGCWRSGPAKAAWCTWLSSVTGPRDRTDPRPIRWQCATCGARVANGRRPAGRHQRARARPPDGEVVNDVGLREQLVDWCESIVPRWCWAPILRPSSSAACTSITRSRETGWALLDAVAPAAAMPLYFPNQGQAHQVRQLLLSGTHEPDVVADVSRTIDTKVKAVLAHASQLAGDDEAIRDLVYGRAEQAGRPVGVAFGEAFRSVELAF